MMNCILHPDKRRKRKNLENVIVGIRKKFIHSDKEQLDAHGLIKDGS